MPRAVRTPEGFRKTLEREDPSRLRRLAQWLGRRDRELTSAEARTLRELEKCGCGNIERGLEKSCHNALAINTRVHGEGVTFEIPSGDRQLYSAELQDTLKRLHINTGHPPNEDLRRILRVSGGSELAQKLAKLMTCSTCARLAKSKLM